MPSFSFKGEAGDKVIVAWRYEGMKEINSEYQSWEY
jgi:hypothetical protein